MQRLARQIPLGINGQSIPVVTGNLTAGWVAEGAQKPASAGTMALKTMDPKKLAVIAVVSAEVVRANPGDYMNFIRDDVARAFAVAFDAAALHGTSTPFSTYVDQTVQLGRVHRHHAGVHRRLRPTSTRRSPRWSTPARSRPGGRSTPASSPS